MDLIDRIVRRHRVQQIIPQRLEYLERLPNHYQAKTRELFIIIESMTIVVVTAWAQYRAILNIPNHNRKHKQIRNQTISNHHNIIRLVRKLNNHSILMANAIVIFTRQRALPTASFPMTCKIGYRQSKNFAAQLKHHFHHHHELHPLHD